MVLFSKQNPLNVKIIGEIKEETAVLFIANVGFSIEFV